MTWSAPSERTISTLRVLHSAVNRHRRLWRVARRMTHGAGPGDDEHLLPCFDSAAVMHRLPRGETWVGYDGGLFEPEAVRLRRELVGRRPGVLGERAPTGSVHLVTDAKSGHVLSDRLDQAGHVGTG